MPVDITTDIIRIRQRDPDSFDQATFRTIVLSEDQGVKAEIGKLKTDPQGSTVIQSYIFEKSKWTSSEAESWVKDHKRASMERRCIDPEPSGMRLEWDKSGPRIYGYAAVFNSRTRLYGNLYEQVAPGAFTDTLKRDNVYALWQHDWTMPLGDLKSGTLRLWEDDKGLGYELNPGDTDYANNLVKNIKRGVVRQSSFGFDAVEAPNVHDSEAKGVIRTLKRVRLFDVSPVTLAAYPATEGLTVREARDGNQLFYLMGDEAIEAGAAEEVRTASPNVDELMKQTADLFDKIRGSQKT